MNLSLCITTYNRYDLLLESFSQVIDNPMISDIVIVDDCSDLTYWNKIKEFPKFNSKIKVFRQLVNRGMSRNKADAISYAENEWCIILDSDNIIDERYLKAIPVDLQPDNFYLPSFAWPTFNYEEWAGKWYGRSACAENIHHNSFNLMMNTCNMLCNRDAYLAVYVENDTMKGTDTIWMNYLWLKAGNSFYVMKDCTYFHRVHDGSGFMADVNYNMHQADVVRKLIQSL